MALPLHATTGERIWHYTFLTICVLIFAFLIIPILVIIPLSFNAQPYFTFTPEMVAFDPAGYSTKWYEAFFSDSNWRAAVKNSLIIALFSTIISTFLGTLAALGLSQKDFPFKTAMMGILISPMIVPLIISAAGMFFFYAKINLLGTHIGVILAHAALATPFVVITVTATLTGFDHSLTRAAANLGSSPTNTFFRITVPLITPGVISGALFAFITSFDEVVVVLFVGSVNQRTIPWAMFSGIREEISPTILAVATLLITFSIILLFMVELLRRRNERLRGITPH
ncbi:ABC transporter permease [Cocleimonas flava]|jgi:putative spermidine/putrescine transport system permease protein|uniref:Putative spermidine/putrescine transport system permease protein n=1 Tax=Cocleimonas flava TaxID=634765 RepID=A0A4R1EW55_9GAMM|nr:MULTISPECIES: ABC transporter permease [Cocleimonas]MEB8433345.1 ABC transporter permease [Cocleimonas sp. KMM 6892]MEC4716156.1 ABC transporter permease [Cocleimonas sp. KMM 6895]MEC4745951.1 ABC transporter permease [Cocleimonas sp. KMM 6896]TCJ85000.1 putative spermidine/putrescine transport system permease protein [Cocleimonas flava]